LRALVGNSQHLRARTKRLREELEKPRRNFLGEAIFLQRDEEIFGNEYKGKKRKEKGFAYLSCALRQT